MKPTILGLLVSFSVCIITFSGCEKEPTDSTTTGFDASLFLNEAINETITTVPCTLSDGTVTECYKVVVNSTPEDHPVGPWCPSTINEVGGIWEDDVTGVLYDVDSAYLNILESRGWDLINPDGSVNVTTDAELELVATQETNNWSFIDAQNNGGIVNHCIQATPVDRTTTLYIPVDPVMLDTPTDLLQLNGESSGVSLNGIQFFPPEPSARITKFQNIAPLDQHGGHTGFGYDYHYHRNLNSPNSSTSIVGYMRDGYPLYGETEPDGSIPTDLDACRGHYTEDLGYHYHSTSEYHYVVGCLSGAHGDLEIQK